MPLRPARSRVSVLIAALLAAVSLVGSSPAVSPAPAAAQTLVPLLPDQLHRKLGREVFGYLPYWELSTEVEQYLRYDLLTTISFFGIKFRTDGSIDTSQPGYQGYVSDTATRIIAAAHAAGVRTAVTIQSFGYEPNARFFSDATAQTRAISDTVALMRSRGADGVNVDVELIESAYLPAFGRFVANLRAAVLAWNPYAQISVAAMANTSGANLAKVAVDNGADRVFVMAYDYRWKGSTISGAVSPLTRADGGWSITRTLDTYAATGVPAAKLILGLPYYGRTWPTTTSALNAPVQTDKTRYGSSTAFFPNTLPGSAVGWTVYYGDPELSIRLVRYDSTKQTWLQTHYDDPTTLTPKVALVSTRGLAGMGMWALGFDLGQPGFWPMIATAFGAPRVTSVTIADGRVPPYEPGGIAREPVAPTAGYTRSTAVVVSVGWTDGAIAATAVRLSNDRATWSAWHPLGEPIPWTLPDGADGRRTVYAQLQGGEATLSTPAAGRIVLDRTRPVVVAPTAIPVARTTFSLTGAAVRIVWSATDGSSRVVEQLLEEIVDGGEASPVALSTPLATAAVTRFELGRTYRHRVSAGDLLGNVTGPLAGRTLRLVPVDDRASGVRFSTGWTRAAASSSNAGTLTWTKTARRSATYSFTGSAIAIVAPVGPLRGAARVYLDGRYVGAFSEYATTNVSRRIVWSTATKPGVTHTIRIETAGTAGRPRIDLDAFLVVR